MNGCSYRYVGECFLGYAYKCSLNYQRCIGANPPTILDLLMGRVGDIDIEKDRRCPNRKPQDLSYHVSQKPL